MIRTHGDEVDLVLRNVLIVGTSSVALNSTTALVQEYVASRERYRVYCYATGKPVLMRVRNLLPIMPACMVKHIVRFLDDPHNYKKGETPEAFMARLASVDVSAIPQPASEEFFHPTFYKEMMLSFHMDSCFAEQCLSLTITSPAAGAGGADATAEELAMLRSGVPIKKTAGHVTTSTGMDTPSWHTVDRLGNAKWWGRILVLARERVKIAILARPFRGVGSAIGGTDGPAYDFRALPLRVADTQWGAIERSALTKMIHVVFGTAWAGGGSAIQIDRTDVGSTKFPSFQTTLLSASEDHDASFQLSHFAKCGRPVFDDGLCDVYFYCFMILYD